MQSSDIKPTNDRYIDLQGQRPVTYTSFQGNSIISSKYTKASFLPKCLFSQFFSIPKLWFLFISILELSRFSLVTYPYSTVLPLSLLIVLGLLREGINDYKCHKSDSLINSQVQKVWNGCEFVDKESKDLLVGDIVLLQNKEVAPADLLILCVGNEEHECYADVSSVIGESNLKVKHPVKDVQSKIDCLDISEACLILKTINADILVNSPNKSFKSFSGKFKLDLKPKSTNVDIDNLLLRGMRVQNTEWVFGLVVYAGIETKIWINNLNRPVKESRVWKTIDRWNAVFLVIIIVISGVNTIVYIGLQSQSGYRDEVQENTYKVFLGNLVLYSHLIQISLYLTIEILRIFTYIKNFYTSTIDMKTFGIISNLGMIEYIVTDKTGTLTENFLDVSLFIISNTLYLNDLPEDNPNSERELIKRPSVKSKPSGSKCFSDVFKDLKDSNQHQLFLMCLALCNLSCLQDGSFVAISEDDKVLSRTASYFGYQMTDRSSEQITLTIENSQIYFSIIGTQAFSSDIKKSRILVRRQDTNEIFLFVKGNREAMINIYDPSTYERQDLEDCIIQFRTLFLGYKKIEEQAALTFIFDYETALISPVNRQGRVENIFQIIEKDLKFLGIVGLEDRVSDETRETVEVLKKAGIKFWVVSGDAEESTLTAAVSASVFRTENKIVRLGGYSSDYECLNALQEAIKENVFIGKGSERHSIESFPNQMGVKEARSELMIPIPQSVYSISAEEIPAIGIRRNKRRSTLLERCDSRKPSIHPIYAKLPIKRQLTSLEGEFNPKNLKFVLSLDSSCLEYGMSSRESQKFFTSLLFTAKTVCFYGILPDQKAKVVRIIKNNFKFAPVVLSVGDGASDIGMIRYSDIGVGINGKEGPDASANADVSIERFGQLKELVLEKGHRHYMQFAKMVMLSIYVMLLMEILLVFYNPLTDWTAGSLFPEELLIVYKLVVNIFPIACLCIIDKDCLSCYDSPKIYRAGIFNSIMSVRALSGYVMTALVQAGFSFVCGVKYYSSFTHTGDTESYLLISVSFFYIISATSFITILIETYAIDSKILISYLFCIGLLIVCTVSITAKNENLLGFSIILSEYSNIWLFLSISVLFNSSVSYFFKVIRYLFFPSIIEKIRQVAPSASFRLHNRLTQYRSTLKSVYRETGNWITHSTYDDDAIDFKVLRFVSNQRETSYKSDKLAENALSFKVLLSLSSISLVTYSVYISVYHKSNQYQIISYHLVYSFLMLLSTFLPKILRLKYSLIYLIVSYILLQTFYLISQQGYDVYYTLPMLGSVPVLYFAGFSHYWLEMNLLVFLTIPVSIIIIVYSFLSPQFYSSLCIFNILEYLTIYLSMILTASVMAYNIDKSKREEFVLVQKVQVEITKRNCVLSYLLPAFVMKRVESGIRYISDDQGVISVIFCDIHNFESILKNYSPHELAAFLDEVYEKFDQICTLTGCTKIETVGKTYMACAGLKDSEAELDPYYSSVSHARRCIEMALSIIRNAEKIYLKNREVLKFNIGINSGPVTAGVVGFHKPQFSLVGDTINTASRMASLCPQANTLQISENTMNFVTDKSGLLFEPSQVNAKGKGVMKTFLVSVPEGTGAPQAAAKGTLIGGSMSELFNLQKGRVHKSTKKITLYQINKAYDENGKRQSSLIEELGVEVAVGNEFVKKKTIGLKKASFFAVGFGEGKKERKFREKTSENTKPIVRYGLLIRVFCNIILVILEVIKLASSRVLSFEVVVKLVIELVVAALLTVFLNSSYKKTWFCWTLIIVYLIGAVFRFTLENTNFEIVFISFLYHLLQIAYCSHLLFRNLKTVGLFAVAAQVLYASITQHPNWDLHIIANLTFSGILMFSIYNRENKLRVFTIVKKAALKKIAKSEALLAEMMPRHVYEGLKDYNSVTESISRVSLLYADIVGFTEWSSHKKPHEVVNMLSDLFQEFDKKCKELEVYKVHTIGDCYVAMGYTGAKERNPNVECFRLANFALELVEIIKRKNTENGTNLNMRIGMHTGNIIGGITGTNIVRYDIYGVDVYIANKMESCGKAGSIKVSRASKEILACGWPKSFVFQKDEDVYEKVNNSRIETYYMERSMEG